MHVNISCGAQVVVHAFTTVFLVFQTLTAIHVPPLPRVGSATTMYVDVRIWRGGFGANVGIHASTIKTSVTGTSFGSYLSCITIVLELLIPTATNA